MSGRRTRKQVLESITSEAASGIDMAKGLQGRGDWHGSATKMISSAGLVDQAIDLAETLPGVCFDRTREQTNLVLDRLKKARHDLDDVADDARARIRSCCTALEKAVDAVSLFASRLNDEPVLKDGEELDFNEDELIKALEKVAFAPRADPKSPEGVRSAERFDFGKKAGIFTKKPGEGIGRKKSGDDYEYSDAASVSGQSGWEAVDGHPGRVRRKKSGVAKPAAAAKKPKETAGNIAAEKPAKAGDLAKTGQKEKAVKDLLSSTSRLVSKSSSKKRKK